MQIPIGLLSALAIAAAIIVGGTSAQSPSTAARASGQAETRPGLRFEAKAPAPGHDESWRLCDYDADGRVDFLLTDEEGRTRLYRGSEGGAFEDVTESVGLSNLHEVTTAAWADFDGEGTPDLFVGTARGEARLYCSSGRAGFLDVSSSSGLELGAYIDSSYALDYDRDGRPDLLIWGPQGGRLYRNVGNRAFEPALQLGADKRADWIASGMSFAWEPFAARSAGNVVEEHNNDPGSAGSHAPGGSAGAALGPDDQSAMSLLSVCSPRLEDEATGSCLQASSVPSLGKLYPISIDLFLDAERNVGMGTTEPDSKLHVIGEVQGTDLCASGDGSPAVILRHGATGRTYYWEQNSNGDCYLRDDHGSGSYRLYLDNGGDVGIGTNQPTSRLTVIGAIQSVNENGHALLRMTSKTEGVLGGDYKWEVSPNGNCYLYDDEANEYRVFVQDGSGWVGLGTSNPLALLDVRGEVALDTLQIRGGADIVEGFEWSADPFESGTVVVADSERPGAVSASSRAYDRRVVGVISGAGGVRSGLRLGQEGVLEGEAQVALVGRVHVLCSAENGAIEVGDLLTTASHAGHAMRATDAERAPGAVIGKALSSLAEGTGLVLVLVNLQ